MHCHRHNKTVTHANCSNIQGYWFEYNEWICLNCFNWVSLRQFCLKGAGLNKNIGGGDTFSTVDKNHLLGNWGYIMTFTSHNQS